MNKKQTFLGLLLTLLLLSGCQYLPKPQKEESTASYTMPEVSYKYEEDEVQDFMNRLVTERTERYEGLTLNKLTHLKEPEKLPQSLYFDSGIQIDYPEDGVKGVYLTATNVGNPEYFDYIVDYINNTELNAVVIDFKDDWGQIISPNDSEHPWVQENTINEVDYHEILKVLEENDIYPIARITTFKDNMLSDEHPEITFTELDTGEIWQDGMGSQFTNPFMKEVWDYNVEVARQAAIMGFKDIQFDYVRFPEGFFEIDETLDYSIGEYASRRSEDPEQDGYERVAAINDFLTYAREQLSPYGVDISADIFGYTTVAGDTYDVRGIGQNISQMAEHVDVISAMIYPSHWGYGFFGLDYPDLYPYELVFAYMFEEKQITNHAENKVRTRPWLQDFTYSYESAAFKEYTAADIQAQIDALYEHGIHEYLLWNAGGEYTEGVDYSPDIDPIVDEKGEYYEGFAPQEETLDEYTEEVPE